jgi:hypothetical protein
MNKGFMGLINFDGTPLEYNSNKDNLAVGLLKGAGQGAIEGLLAVGTIVTTVVLLTSKK